MATYTKLVLSGSSNGRSILVAATASPGTVVHSTGTSATELDEVWIYAHNSNTSSVSLTIEFGGTSAPNDAITLTLPSKAGLTLVLPGLILSGNGTTASTVRAYAGTTSVVTISGYVHRIA